MEREIRKNHKIFTTVGSVVISFAVGLTLMACSSAPTETESTMEESVATESAMESTTEMSTDTSTVNWKYSSPITSDATKLITQDQWKEYYPNQYDSLAMNLNDDQQPSLLEADPYLVTIYAGIGFSKDYNEPRGHGYAIEDINKTQRVGENTKATCIACKGPGYPLDELQMGAELYTTPFSDVASKEVYENNTITCYDCHLNNPAGVTSSRQFFNTAFPQASIEWGVSNAACGQCHNEYYFNTDDHGVTVPPYTDPTEILDYFNDMDFVDFTNPTTGVKQLKAQHPEVQMYADSVHQEQGLGCVDCHMERKVADDGTIYTSHEIVNPLESEIIQQQTCAKCHGDVDALLVTEKELTDGIKAKETSGGEALAAFTDQLSEVVASGEYTDDQLAQIRSDARDAQWYFDFEYVENSYGFHNFDKANMALDTASEILETAQSELDTLTK